MEKVEPHKRHELLLPQRTLLVLCGPAGSGKSTFARRFIKEHRKQGFRSTMIVSSDTCRALVCDDETNQQVNRDGFDLFYYIINKRMLQGRFTIADSTALQGWARQRLLSMAQRHNYYTCILAFDIPLEKSVQQDRQRERIVGEDIIAYHTDLMQQVLQALPDEGWHKILIVNEPSTINIDIRLSVAITGVSQ
jgi:predicted kinase